VEIRRMEVQGKPGQKVRPYLKKHLVWRHTSVIPAMQEVKVGGFWFKAGLSKKQKNTDLF
jgi:hypothetical protein